jgi:hypothetical protein
MVKWFKVKLLLSFFVFSGVLFYGLSAQACCGCRGSDCGRAVATLYRYHQEITDNTNQAFDEDLEAFENWMEEVFFPNEIMPALRMFTTQMSAVMMQHAQIIGSFFDAKQQLETQRLFQELQAEIHRDYIPSDEFCWFGTNTRSMAPTSTKAKNNAISLSQQSIARQLGKKNAIGSDSVNSDLTSRWDRFRKEYCDPADNNRSLVEYTTAIASGDAPRSGLQLACDHDGPGGSDDVGADELNRTNKDVDYTRVIDLPRTLNVDYADGDAKSDDEMDVVALSRNIYGHRVLTRSLSGPKLDTSAAQNLYFALRSVVAKRSVAEYTYNSIVGLKSAGTVEDYEDRFGVPLSPGHTRQYLAAIVRELYPHDPSLTCSANGDKLCDWDIFQIIGHDPSYYSQLEIMAKKMYQNPDFYVKLYDTPANVARKGVAMRAIELMLDREMYESQLRREMTVSVLLSSRLRALERRVNETFTRTSIAKD